ncbi:GFA family protein [Sphingomonas nostoxanthinifaciens]|uniref:GFA family protein n=1 Tax=Sphingomonas nostoxanthinifaciens TaxID=2872652 RepID=UPI001CC212B7|nr:GFA family protein [Sphingomonas nostoxanthinifaciens]UAK24289.1 GFA family protein [Sphingomonas nostoxanthinifaciens]
MKVEGGCHCGLVRFEAEVADGPVEVLACGCSICAMTGFQHVIVPQSAFRIVEGRRETTTYRFGSGSARHIFCTQCGVKSFLTPRGRPDAMSLNLRCLDEGHGLDVTNVAVDQV